MASVSTCFNFPRCTEEAFQFYRSVFGGDFNGPVHRFSAMPAAPGQPPLPEADKNLVMHIELPMADMFWGAVFGSLTDRFGVRWMFNCEAKA